MSLTKKSVKSYCNYFFSMDFFKKIAYQTKQTVYNLKKTLLDDYLIQQMKHASIPFA